MSYVAKIRDFFQSFRPEAVYRGSSDYNSDIVINKHKGRYRLFIGGSWQSGSFIEKLWLQVLSTIPVRRIEKAKKILVLGVGGGDVIHLLRDRNQSAKIEAVDIDELILSLSQKYFGLEKMKRLTLVESDARDYIQKQVKAGREYDIVVVDIFSGRHIPDFVSDDAFLARIHSIVAKEGLLLINYLRENEYQKKSNILLDKLSKIFQSVTYRELFANRFFYANK